MILPMSFQLNLNLTFNRLTAYYALLLALTYYIDVGQTLILYYQKTKEIKKCMESMVMTISR